MSSSTDDQEDGVKYLLSLQVLMDLCSTADNPARAWARSLKKPNRLRLSVITVALARSAVNGLGQDRDGERLRARLVDLLAKLKADGGEPLSFGESAAAVWQSFMREPSLGDMVQVDRQFFAAAFSEGLCVVDYVHPLSAALPPLGIKVHSLVVQP